MAGAAGRGVARGAAATLGRQRARRRKPAGGRVRGGPRDAAELRQDRRAAGEQRNPRGACGARARGRAARARGLPGALAKGAERGGVKHEVYRTVADALRALCPSARSRALHVLHKQRKAYYKVCCTLSLICRARSCVSSSKPANLPPRPRLFANTSHGHEAHLRQINRYPLT
eukprot:scaffold83337_cov64-Phaeocystis_antarctica.AAC.3